MRKFSVAALAVIGLACGGCAANSGVVPIGPETFMVSRQAATGFSGLGNLKAEALREAEQYCANQKKVLQIVNSNESQPPYVFGNFPRAEVQFMCLDANDPELARPKMRKEPDVILERDTVTTIARPQHSDSARTVRVAIESNPAGAEIYVDGAFVGSAPLPEFSMVVGEHLLEIKKSGFVTWSRTIRIIEGAPTRVTATLDVAMPKQ